MHEGHQLWQRAMRVDQPLRHIDGMARRVAQPLQPIDIGEMFEQALQRPGISEGVLAAIGVDVLADQRDLAHASVDEALRLCDDLRDVARDFSAAGIRHDAE